MHPAGASKAKFFRAIGFRPEEFGILAAALKRMAKECPVLEFVETEHGLKYIIDGELFAPNGNVYGVRTIWIIDLGVDLPRLVTAYPQD